MTSLKSTILHGQDSILHVQSMQSKLTEISFSLISVSEQSANKDLKQKSGFVRTQRQIMAKF